MSQRVTVEHSQSNPNQYDVWVEIPERQRTGGRTRTAPYHFVARDRGRFACDDDNDTVVGSYEEAVALLTPLAAAEFGWED